MFPQMWSSTALGFGGVGGAAMTTAYTVILLCQRTAYVYWDGRFAYKTNDNELIKTWVSGRATPSKREFEKLSK